MTKRATRVASEVCDVSAVTSNLLPHYRPLVSGRGIQARDLDGHLIEDMSGQTLNLSLGHAPAPIVQAACEQLRRLPFASSRFGSKPFFELARQLVARAPAGLTAVNLKQCDGSDAVETAIKLARLYTRRTKLLALPGAWHGETALCLALHSRAPGRDFLSGAHDVRFAEQQTPSSLAQLVLKERDAAAAIIDPVGVSHGLFNVETLKRELAQLRSACAQTGTLLIFDEVQTFGGYLGDHLFAAEAFRVTPDLLCIGKALGSVLPLAATLCHGRLRSLLDYNEAEFTYGGQPPACAAAIAALKVYDRNRARMRTSVKAIQRAAALLATRHPDVEVRQIGYFLTVARSTGAHYRRAWAKLVYKGLWERKYLARFLSGACSVLLKPPTVVTARQVDGLARAVSESITAAEAIMAAPPVEMSALGLMGPEPRFTRVRKAAQSDVNFLYVQGLLDSISIALRLRVRSPAEEEEVVRTLSHQGIATSELHTHGEGVEYAFVPGQPLSDVLRKLSGDPSDGTRLLWRHQGMLEHAHDQGLIVGDRWPGNTIVSDNGVLAWIDFGISYDGDFQTLSAFEELFALFQSVSFLRSKRLAREAVERLMPRIWQRHEHVLVQDVWRGMRGFYVAADKPTNSTSLSRDAYLSTVREFERVADALVEKRQTA